MQVHQRPSSGPFSLAADMPGRWPSPLRRLVAGAAERVTGLATLGALYESRWRTAEGDGADFCVRALEILGIDVSIVSGQPSVIPATGPLIVVANHPHGALDGLVLDVLVRRVRPDVKLLGNSLLARIDELRDRSVFVDVFGVPHQERRGAAFDEALAWLGRGGALIAFPAGEVAHVESPDGRLTENPWRTGAVRLAAASGAAILPVGIRGRNSRLFFTAGRLHRLLRTALLPRELLRHRGRAVQVAIGCPVAPGDLAGWRDDRQRAADLRARTAVLAEPAASARPGSRQRPIADPVDADDLERDVRDLPPSRLLLSGGEFDVYCAPARELPHVLVEIGRLREITFRAVQEGTGRPLDLDRFDRRYLHLFLWHRTRREIAGAYRLGATDGVGLRGSRALYTRTLFDYGTPLLRALGPALELGRSFVRAEYQRDYGTLLLLWKGIGRFVARHPKYRRLFGPVSISAAYHPVSRELLVDSLAAARLDSAMSPLVRGKRPVCSQGGPRGSGHLFSPDDLPPLIQAIEPDGKAIPVLLRQYLKLGARALAFSVDPDFGHVVDGLVVVDLLRLERPQLARYLGPDGVGSFLAHHAGAVAPATPASLEPRPVGVS